jgi:hypothetical protein
MTERKNKVFWLQLYCTLGQNVYLKSKILIFSDMQLT